MFANKRTMLTKLESVLTYVIAIRTRCTETNDSAWRTTETALKGKNFSLRAQSGQAYLEAPRRATVRADLMRDAKIEMEVVVYKPERL